MTVISACILSRQKPLLARQFVEISKVRIEGLMNAFLKLVENAGQPRKNALLWSFFFCFSLASS